MYDYTRLDRIRNEVIREKVKVESIEDKMRENRLTWFGHVKRRRANASMRKCKMINLQNVKDVVEDN